MTYKKYLRRPVTLVGMVFAFAALLVGFLPGQAMAVEATSATNYFAQFNDGRVGWYKVALEVSAEEARAKITVWCEPNTTPGGSKVACDAIDLYETSPQIISVDVWIEGEGWRALWYGNAGGIDYSPPEVGISQSTSWGCSAWGEDQYRATAHNFRAASSNQWSQEYTRTTPTWNGYIGRHCL